jgi:hypothetical protein
MWARIGFAWYAILTIFLGVVYSWNWAAVVVVMGVIPAFLIWLVASNMSKTGDYYERDWYDLDPRKK